MNSLYNSWRSFQDNFLQYLSAILLVGLTLLALLEVVRRYVFGVSFEWQQDLVTFGILSGIFLFFGITQARKAHLRVSALLLLLREKCGPSGRLIARFAEIFGQLLAVWICAYIVWTSIDHLFYLIKEGRKTESLYFSMWPFFLTFLISIGFLGISFFFQLWNEIRLLLGLPGIAAMQEEEEDSGPIL